MGVALLGALVGPSVTVASGLAPTVPDVHITTAEDTPYTGNLLAGATDPEEDALHILSWAQVGAAFGHLDLNTTTGAFTFTPAANQSGSTSTWFFGTDGTTPVYATLFITITPVNDPPACPSPVTTSGAEDNQQTGTFHCTDVEGSSLTYALADGATHGTAGVNADGSWTYMPDANYNGPDSFTYKANDGDLDSNTATVNVTVTEVNDAPTCTSPVAVTAPEDGVGSGTLACADVDSASLTYSLVGAAAHGTAVVRADGSWTYIPVPDYTGPDTFTFKASDGSLDSGTATANVTVLADTTAPVVAAPRVVFGSGRVDETAPLLVSWSATDSGVGVASYEVQVNVAGAGWKAVYTGPNTSITRSYAFSRTLVWRVRATDKASNTSGWVSSATRRLVAYQAPGNSAIKYTGTWTNVAQAASSGTGYRYVTTRYSKATLTFTGSAVLFVAPKTFRSGYVKVYVDGHLVGRYSEYRAASLVGQIVARASWGANGTHSIRISNDQSGRRANLDAFIVLR